MFNIEYTIYRDEQPIELEVSARFYQGELEYFTTSPKVALTADEFDSIETKLVEEF